MKIPAFLLQLLEVATVAASNSTPDNDDQGQVGLEVRAPGPSGSAGDKPSIAALASSLQMVAFKFLSSSSQTDPASTGQSTCYCPYPSIFKAATTTFESFVQVVKLRFEAAYSNPIAIGFGRRRA